MRIHELELSCADTPATGAFYRDVLGLKVDTHANHATIHTPGTRLHLLQSEARPTYHFAFNIAENLVDSAREWAGARVPLLAHPETGSPVFAFAPWNAHALYFEDPAGNIVELIARHRLANAQPPPFGPECIESVSEIGIVVDDVGATADRLARENAIPRFGPRSEDFAPMGDDQGLFIVASVGRPWYPTTDRPAIHAPARALVSAPPDPTTLWLAPGTP